MLRALGRALRRAHDLGAIGTKNSLISIGNLADRLLADGPEEACLSITHIQDLSVAIFDRITRRPS